MNTTATATRIHPLMAAAAASVIIVSLTGAAAITGMLPSSRSAPEPQAVMTPTAMHWPPRSPNGQLQAATQTLYANGQPLTAHTPPDRRPDGGERRARHDDLYPVRQQPCRADGDRQAGSRSAAAKPRVVERIVERRVVEHRPARQVTHYQQQTVYRQAPAPAQPHYVGIGTGAVIGGLIGNQVGGGNGKKLATLAGIIGGGFVGNEVAKRTASKLRFCSVGSQPTRFTCRRIPVVGRSDALHTATIGVQWSFVGGDLVSTWVVKQCRAYRGLVTS